MMLKRYIELQIKNHSYFIFFFCIGLFLNFDLSSDTNSCPYQLKPNTTSPSTNPSKANTASFSSQKPVAKKLIRPRYYSTELGIREKLFVGVLTSAEQIADRTLAINKTLAHLVDKIKYFMSVPHRFRPTHTLGNVVGFTDTRDALRPFHVMKYIADGFAQNYDYFLLMKDSAYVNARTVKYIVNKVSVSQHVYLGTKLAEDSTFCSLDAGILLSNSVVMSIMEHLDWCVKNAFSDNHGENLGRCIAHSLNLDCQEEVQAQTLMSYHLRRPSVPASLDHLQVNQVFNNAAIVHPVSTSTDIYTLHAYYSRAAATRTLRESHTIVEEVQQLRPKLPAEHREMTWPVGRRTGASPQTRFDVGKHIYFNMTHKLFQSDYRNVDLLTETERIDIREVLEAVKTNAKNDYGHLVFKRLVNGYRLFDLSRGLDYTFDIGFKDLTTGKEQIKRFKVCKPLGSVELLPVPYVTENGRVTLIITVGEDETLSAISFINTFTKNIARDRRQKTFLLFVLMYESTTPSKDERDVFKDVKKLATKTTSMCRYGDACKMAWLSVRLPQGVRSANVHQGPLIFAAVDLGLGKVGADSLVLVLDAKVDISAEFLNRVKMNTISGFQIFNPIPFRLYNPHITKVDSSHRLDIHKSTGQFDALEYNYIAFYGKDYVNVRLKSEQIIPIVRNDRDIQTMLDAHISNEWDIFSLFVKYADLHCLRATDPGIKVNYLKDSKGPFASKTQLAKYILGHGSARGY